MKRYAPRKFLATLAINRSVAISIAGKVFFALLSLAASFLVAQHFSPEIQGYFYTFSSVLALKILVELGLGTVITIYISHEWIKLRFNQNGLIVGSRPSYLNFLAICKFSLKWYFFSGILIFFFLATAGNLFFNAGVDGSSTVRWTGPWVMLSAITTFNIWLLPAFVLLDGCSETVKTYSIKFYQILGSGLILCGAIYFNAGLWAASFSGAMELLIAIYFLDKWKRKVIISIFKGSAVGSTFSWFRDLLPMQWRISLSWLSGYLTFYLFTPIIFHFQGSIEAGRIGITWTFVSGLSALASSWVVPRVPIFSQYIAQGERSKLNQLLKKIFFSVFMVATSGVVGMLALLKILDIWWPDIALRFLAPLPTAYLLVATGGADYDLADVSVSQGS